MSSLKNIIYNPSLKKSENREVWIVTFLLFFLTNPYFFWNWYGNLFVTILVSSIAMVIFWRKTGRLTRKQRNIFVFWVLVWLLYLLNEFTKGARLGVVAYFPFLLLGMIPFVKKDFLKAVFELFLSCYAIIIGISMISWIAGITGLISPIGQIGEGIARLEVDNKTYLMYPLSLVSTRIDDDFLRFYGLYGEPGVVGTLSGLMLCAKRYNMKDWRSIILLLSGILSTSMFFYGLTAVYWLSELVFIRKKFGLFILIVLSIGTAYVVTKDNVVVSHLVWERFEWDASKGDFKGNSRGTISNSTIIQSVSASGEIWFGVRDTESFFKEGHSGGTIYAAIAMYGLIFVLVYMAWLILVGNYYIKNRWDFLLYCFVVISCMYQRPDLFSLPHGFLFICIARYLELEFIQKYYSIAQERLVS